MRFAERVRLMRNKRNEDWWHIVFAGPIGHILNAVIAEVRWITPNGLTLASFALKIGSGVLMLPAVQKDVSAVIALQLSGIFDVMDGSLARYRRQSSVVGAFLDKVTDAIGLAILGCMAGYRAFWEDGELAAIFAGVFIGASFLARCYMYWVVTFYARERNRSASSPQQPIAAYSDLNLRQRMAYYLRSTWLIVHVGEGDITLWLSIALLASHLRVGLYAIAAAMAVHFVLIFFNRLLQMRALDRAAA